METTKKKRTNQKLSASYIFFKDSRSITQVIGYARLRKKKYFFCSTQTRVSHYTLRSTYKESSTTRTHLCTHKKIICPEMCACQYKIKMSSVCTLTIVTLRLCTNTPESVRKKKVYLRKVRKKSKIHSVCVCVCAISNR